MQRSVCDERACDRRQRTMPTRPSLSGPTVKAAALLCANSGDEEFMELVFPPSISISHYTIKSFTVWKNNLWEKRVQ